MAASPATIVGAVLIGLFEALGWLMALGGTGKLHSDCKDSYTTKYCETSFRAAWWSIFFQLFVVVGVAIFVAANALEKFRIPLVGFLVLTTVRMMEEAEKALSLSDTSGIKESAVDAAAGGFVILSMMNFLLIALVGSTGVPNVNMEEVIARVKALVPAKQQNPDQQTPPQPPPVPTAPVPPESYPKPAGFEPQHPPMYPPPGAPPIGATPEV